MSYLFCFIIVLLIFYGIIKFSITSSDGEVGNNNSWNEIVKDWKLLSLMTKSNGLNVEYYERLYDASLDELVLVLTLCRNDKYVLECFTKTYIDDIMIEGHKYLNSYDSLSSEFFDDYIMYKSKILLGGIKEYMNKEDNK